MPSVIYALLACGERILADHTNPRFTGDFRATAVKLLSKAQRSSDKEVTFNLQGHVFSFSAKGADMWYCAMSDEAYGKQMPFFFINDVAEAFTKQFEDPASLSDSIVKAQFGAKLSAKVEQYSNPDDSDKVARAQTSLDELRVVLTDNVELAVKRNTDLNAIADTASTFSIKSATLCLVHD